MWRRATPADEVRDRGTHSPARETRATHAPKNRDENTDYYVAKLDELVKKFGGVEKSNAKAPEQESLAL